jgi:DNA-binding NarL/FixJ family response regulator
MKEENLSTEQYLAVQMRRQGYSWAALAEALGKTEKSARYFYYRAMSDSKISGIEEPQLPEVIKAFDPVTPLDNLIFEEAHQLMERIEKKFFTARQYIAFTLRCQGKTWKEIGDHMGIDRQAARCHGTQARRVMLKRLRRENLIDVAFQIWL